MVGVLGVEPRTSSLSGTRSNQLSYTPVYGVPVQAVNLFTGYTFILIIFEMVEHKGLEPLTPCLQSRCSSQLS